MIGRRRASAPASDPWDDEGRRLAPQLAGVSAAIVVGRSADAAARVALALARVTAQERRVALADLAGALSPLGVIGADAAPGITESFLHDITLNDVAHPAADGTPGLFILPRGLEALTADVLRSERWRRLAAGFADAGALLLIVAPRGGAGA